jgi:tetratricopeptide (TPR) repeat protein
MQLENKEYQLILNEIIELYKKEDTKGAIKRCLEALEKFDTKYEIHNLIAASYEKNNNNKKAELHYQKSLKIKPLSVTYTNYATLLDKVEKYELAIINFKKALDLNPKNYQANNNMAMVYEKLANNNEALQKYKDAIEIDPKNFLAYFNIGNIYRKLGKFVDALDFYKKAEELEKENIDIKNNIGITLYDLKKYDESIKKYNDILKKDSKNITTYINITTVYRVLGKLKKARECTLKALKLNENKDLEGIIYSNLAAIELEAGEYKKSIGYSENGIILDPKNFIAYDNVCLACQKLGEYKKLNDLFDLLYKNLNQSTEIISKNSLLNKKLSEMDNFVALVKNSGRTGSIFLHSLLDGHPEIMTIPGVFLKGYFHPDVWDKLYQGNKDSNWRINLLRNFFILYEPMFDASSLSDVPGQPMAGPPGHASGLATLGNNKDKVFKIDKKLFGSYLYTYLESFDFMERSTFFKLIHLAYDSTIQKNTKPGIVFFHIHNPTFVESAQFIKDFPSTRFLQIIRDPIQALDSWCRVEKKEDKNEIMINNDYIENNKYHNKFALVLNYYNDQIIKYAKDKAVIRLEDIKLDTENTLNKLSKWLGINFNDTMMRPSFNEDYYWGKSKSSPNLKGFSKESINRKIGVFFSESDKERILPLMHPYRKEFHYNVSSDERFYKALERLEKKINEPFDFESEIIAQSRSDDERITSQIKGLRVLMLRIIQNLKDDNHNILPPLLQDIVKE